MGVLSALPLIYVGNACCCLWVIAGGLVAAYVLQQNQAAPISPGDGALVGLLAGLFGAVVQAVVSIPIDLIVGPMQRAVLQRVLDMTGNMPSDMREVLERVSREGLSPAWFALRWFIGLVFWLFVGAIFSTVGGVIGAAVFKKNTPPGTIDVTPTAS
jgi:hypothetical protein